MEMLKSPDEENQVLALSILDQQNPKTIPVTLMLCHKFGNAPDDLWQKHAAKAKLHIMDLATKSPYTSYSFQQLAALLNTASTEELKVFCEEYAYYLTKHINNPLILQFKINIILKQDEQY